MRMNSAASHPKISFHSSPYRHGGRWGCDGSAGRSHSGCSALEWLRPTYSMME